MCKELIDIGANISLASEHVVHEVEFEMEKPGSSLVVGSRGRALNIVGKVELSRELCGNKEDADFFGIDQLPEAYDGILGQDIIIEWEAKPIIRAKHIHQKVYCPYSVELPGKHIMLLTVSIPEIHDTVILLTPCWLLFGKKSFSISHAIAKVHNKHAVIKAVNFSEEKQTLPEGTFIGITQIFSDDFEIIPEFPRNWDVCNAEKTSSSFKIKDLDIGYDGLTSEQLDIFHSLMHRCQCLFPSDGRPMGQSDISPIYIDKGNHPFVFSRPYCPSPDEKVFMDKYIQKLLDQGSIKKSTSSYASPAL